MPRTSFKIALLWSLSATVLGACSDDKGNKPDGAPASVGDGAADSAATGDGGAATADGNRADGAATDATGTDASGTDATGTDATPPVFLAAPAAGTGVQIRMTSQVAAGDETERCRFYKVPAEGLNLVREELKFTAGSHHVLIYQTTYKEIPTKTISGETLDTAGVFDCVKNGPTGDWETIGLLGGSQSPNSPPTIDGMPEGTAIKIAGGSILLVDAHYLNASANSLTTEIYINLHSIASDKVKQEAGVLFFYNPFILVPSMGEGVARQRCPISKDINLVVAQSHMHRRGVDYMARIVDPVAQTDTELYHTEKWADIDSKILNPIQVLKAGQLIDFACKYKNTESRVVTQGRTTKDEMCVFAGVYYPRDIKTEYCSLTNDFSGRFMGGLWIGNGTKTGAQTAGCFQGAKATSEDKGASFFGCVTDSCPKSSKETSDVARCLSTSGLGMCATDCAGATANPANCKTCIGTKCTPAFTALAAATCQ